MGRTFRTTHYGMAADIYDKKYNVTKCNQTFEHKKIAPNLDKSNRYGRLVPQDFKSCASASSATAAFQHQSHFATELSSLQNGTNRARTYDPLLVRQMLSQLSYDPILIVYRLLTKVTSKRPRRDSNSRPPP